MPREHLDMEDKSKTVARKTLRCRVCGSDDSHKTYFAKEMMYGTREIFAYFQCSECGCLQILETPPDMSAYYPSDYYSYALPQQPISRAPAIRRTLEKWIARQFLFNRGYKQAKLASQFVKPPPELFRVDQLLRHCQITSFQASFLDVGCGAQSWWLNDLQALGFKNLVGVDPFVNSNQDRDNISIRRGSLESIREKFDVISMHHSLEHTPDQLATLTAARQLLNRGGCCLVRIPLVSSLAWDKYGTNWAELDAPRHLFLHSTRSIELAGQRAGLTLHYSFWDSDSFEFWGSEQYVRDIPLKSPNSFAVNPDNSDFTYKEMAAYRDTAIQVNKDGRGGRGVFYFFAN